MQGEFGFGDQGGLPGSSGDAYLPGTFSSCLCGGFLGSLGRKLEGVYITILETFGVEVEQEEIKRDLSRDKKLEEKVQFRIRDSSSK